MPSVYAYVVSVLVLYAVSWPLWLDPGEDDFPISTYPMFARPKPRTVEVLGALAVASDGSERPVPPTYVANSEPMLALSTLRKSVARGRSSARALCKHIAARLLEEADADYADADRIVIATRTLDAIAYLAGEREPEAERVHVRCAVPSRAGGDR